MTCDDCNNTINSDPVILSGEQTDGTPVDLVLCPPCYYGPAKEAA